MSNFIEQFKKKRRNFVKDLGGKVLWRLEKIITNYSKVSTEPFLDPYQFDWAGHLENNWRIIRDELDKILRYKESIPRFQDISEDRKSISKDDDWRTFFLYGFGYKATINCSKCPETTRLIESISDMTTAFFSILNPGKHIPEHRGVFKGFLRYHLGLKVPRPAKNCRIRVGRETAHWQEGKGILFDDTYRHEVWNDTDETRVVLLLDMWNVLGILQDIPAPDSLARLPVWNDSATGELHKRARAYLDVNCGMCHNPGGSANNSRLFLDLENEDSYNLGIYKRPLATGSGSGDLEYDIVPGKPDSSILVYRMEATEPQVRMPELGRTLVHEEGVKLIREWIEKMDY